MCQVATSIETFDDLYGKIIVTDFIAVASGFRSNTVICGFHSHTSLLKELAISQLLLGRRILDILIHSIPKLRSNKPKKIYIDRSTKYLNGLYFAEIYNIVQHN